MKHIDASPSSEPRRTNWQILGELELPISSECAARIATWLKENLSPLKLQADFTNRLLKSAQAAAVRAEESSVAAIDNAHIHLAVFAPIDHEADGKTWGFFRLEKLEGAVAGKNPSDHSIEFYLYIEGN